VKKTSIYLEPELDRTLTRAAAERGVTKAAELIRRMLRAALGEASRPRITAIGLATGPGDVADAVDRHLREIGFGE
jgi:hypothetical protein